MANYDWYKTSYRRNLTDMHIEDWNGEFLSEFDPHAYIDCMKRGNIKSAMIYTHSHNGLCNWPTKTGRVHNAFRNENKIKELIGLCRAEGIDAVGYYSLIFNCWAYDAHPEWRMADITGKTSREPGFIAAFNNRYGLVCPNNMEYRAFLSEQLAELFDVYDLDGIFLDMAFWPTACACAACRDRYFKETGGKIPATTDYTSPDWAVYQQCRENWMNEFTHFASNECRRIRPGIPVEHNNACLTISWVYAFDGGAADASDFVGGDQYGGQYEQSVVSKMFYEFSNNRPFEYMTSRCAKLVNEHTTTKSAELLKLHNYLTMSHHGAMLFIDAIDPVGTMNPKVYDLLGEVFRESEPYEKYMRGEMASEVAYYFDMKSKKRFLPGDTGPIDKFPQLESLLEGSKALVKGNYLYTVVPDARKEKILDKKAVIVTEAFFLSERDIDFLAGYVENGGNLYISGGVNPKLAGKLLSLEFDGWTEWKQSYIAPTEEGLRYFGDYTAKYPVSFPKSQMLVRNPANHKVLATVTLPYTSPSDFTRFASIHTNPPGIPTGHPAVIMGGYGKGRVIWSAGAFEGNASGSHKDVFLNLFALLYGGKSALSSTAPECVQFTLFDDEDDRKLLLHAVNVQEQEPFFKAGSFNVALKTDKPVRGLRRLPGYEETAFRFEAGELSFEARDMDLFAMYEISY